MKALATPPLQPPHNRKRHDAADAIDCVLMIAAGKSKRELCLLHLQHIARAKQASQVNGYIIEALL